MKKHISLISLNLILATSITACVGNNEENNNQQGLQSSYGSATNATNATTRDWSFSYTDAGELASATNPLGGVITYTYDDSGNITEIKDELGHTSQLNSYNAQGNPQSIIDQNGVTTTLAYTPDGYVSSSTTAGYTTNFTYDAANDLTKVTNPDGSFISYTYDDARRITEISNGGGSIKFTLDAAGNRTSQTIEDPSGEVVFAETKVYDELSRILKTVGANGAQSFSYDLGNNLTSSQDGRDNTTNYAWDALNRVTKVTDAKGGVTKYGYGNNEQPTSIRDAKDGLTSYNYNGLDNLTTQNSPDSGNSKFTTYDAAGNLTTKIDANGQTINYTYDALSRPTSISYSSDSNQNVNFVYDSSSYGIGKLSKISNATSSISYNYDEHGNMIGETQAILGKNYSLKYTYNKSGKLASITYPNGLIVSYNYDNAGNVAQVLAGSTVLATVKHLPFGPITSIAYSNGLQLNMTYNSSYLVTQIQMSAPKQSLFNRSYTYYPNNDIKSIIDPTFKSDFEYDQLRQVTVNKTNVVTEKFGYDAVGNITNAVIYGATLNHIIASDSNRVLSTNGSTTNVYSYDNNGNMTQVDNRYYRYDSVNRLTRVESATKVFETYTYNPWSQRISKELSYYADKPVYIYVYNKSGELLTEIDGTRNNKIRNYIWLDGAPLAIIEDSSVYFYHNDHNGAPVVLTDSAQSIVWTPEYFFAFGQTYVGKAAIKQNLRLPGQYYDVETKLHYNWHRYYSPLLGRYGTSDPLGLAAGMNTYSYVNNNPVNFTDPTGLETYQCTKPLHGLGLTKNIFYYPSILPTFHEYSCIVNGKSEQCGGQDRADNASGMDTVRGMNVPSKPSVDHMNPEGGKCNKTMDDNQCFENCMKEEWAQPRPKYNLYNKNGGLNCQRYDTEVNASCRNQCGL